MPASDSVLARRPVPDRVVGCLLGGAVGDALGGPVEFLTLAEIRARYGREGIRDLVPSYGRLGAITDDTQMTLFTAEGLLQARRRGRERGIWHPPTMVYHAYLRWLETQGLTPPYPFLEARDGDLLRLPALHARRAPGNDHGGERRCSPVRDICRVFRPVQGESRLSTEVARQLHCDCGVSISRLSRNEGATTVT